MTSCFANICFILRSQSSNKIQGPPVTVTVLPLVSGVPHMKVPTVSLDSMGKWQGRKVKLKGTCLHSWWVPGSDPKSLAIDAAKKEHVGSSLETFQRGLKVLVIACSNFDFPLAFREWLPNFRKPSCSPWNLLTHKSLPNLNTQILATPTRNLTLWVSQESFQCCTGNLLHF